MNKIFEALLSALPTWIAWPFVVIVGILLSWDKLRGVANDLLPFQRTYAFEKRKLELLKLIYEIEAIKRQHKIEDLSYRLPKHMVRNGGLQKYDVKVNNAKIRLGLKSKLLYGSIGALITQIIGSFVGYGAASLAEIDFVFIIGTFVRYCSLSIMSGIFVLLLHPRTYKQALLQGAFFVLAISLFAQNFVFIGARPPTRFQ